MDTRHGEPHTFKAWSHRTPPFSLDLVEQQPPKPADLKPHEVLVEIHTAALNPVDVQLANLPIFRLPALSYPKGIGCDFAGVILGKGKNVKGEFPIGGEVMGVTMAPLAGPNGGTLSEIAVIDTTRSAIIPKPPHLTWAQAAAVPLVFLTAKTVLSPPYLLLPRSANPDPTSADSHAIQPVIVVLGGSSAVGQYTIQLVKKRLHAKVVVTCSKKNEEFVKRMGADVVIDYRTEDVAKRLREERPKEGYVEIVDCVGGTEMLPHLSELLAPRSREYHAGGNYVTIVGDKTGRSSMGGAATYLWNPQMVLRMLKGWLWGGIRYNCVLLNSRADWLSEVSHLATSESLEIPLDAEFDFEDVPRAYERLNEGRATGKIVVRVKKDATRR
ncbi:hypothetical protein JCM8547_000878 [Rhodosporidiobolus lusitaniae]